MNKTEDGARTDLRSDASAMGIVNFRGTKNSDEDDARANVKDSAGTKKVFDLRDTIIAVGIDID